MIVVDLSPVEARAYESTRDVEDFQIESTLILDALVQSGLPYEVVAKRVAPLVEAAKGARRKIAEATAYEIRVVGGEA